MSRTRFLVGITRRTVGDEGPVRHAATWHRRTRTGETYAALCGAGVRHADSLGMFDTDHDRACPACVKKAQTTTVAGGQPWSGT